ncbi:D-alanyl-D-alanine carboxypeptidase [Viridibacillus sp. YIM B01967]|uniref:D-alanyl-D-alanine carboxypeptidase n=2 Tax=Viridibacillus soli TaxID=2798301 RepID=A0ABS1H8Q6_9BACL|nr:D-alanyl-D-alanine carboxypeptidase [Viridibacillus soli]
MKKSVKLLTVLLVIAVLWVANLYINDQQRVTQGEPELHSSNAILVDLKSKKVMIDKQSEMKIYPASLTKMMTVIVALEHLPDLEQQVTLPFTMFNEIQAANASVAGFTAQEQVSVRDLLYGNMLPSGADASVGLAIAVAGSEEGFVKLMNDKAKKVGMNDTHFMNATGLHDAEHYSTVKDLSKLLRYALKDETFYEVFTAQRYTTSATNIHPNGITFTSSMFDKLPTASIEGGTILGGKTGYTDKAGLCLASLAEKNDRKYIFITTGAPGDHNTEQFHLIDAMTVYNQMF